MEWTTEQKNIIDARGTEMLVSAAAGSGKTAVLVERIYHRLMDEREPADIDRFVVVTFTNAAAAEMKERLRKRMERALREESLSAEQRTHLRRQIRLVPAAHISTVHSFCSFVIGQYFHRIGIDPGLTTAPEEEIRLLRHEVAEQLLALEYEEEKEDFTRIAGLFTLNKNDEKLEEWILQVYDKLMSEPFPDMLAAGWERILKTPVEEDSPYTEEMLTQVFRLCGSIADRCGYLKEACRFLPEKKFQTIRQIDTAAAEILRIAEKYNAGALSRSKAYEAVRLVLLGTDFSKGLPKSSKDEELNAICEQVLPLRLALEEQRDEYFLSLAELEKERSLMAESCLTVLRLAVRFRELFSEAKRERGIGDYNDLEQYALQILYDRTEEGSYVRSDVARELAEGFTEIMIDEYQDSNRVQDTILWSIAKSDNGDPGLPPWECTATNRFMVGDLKQSIYRFRNACPELFENKLRQATTEQEPGKPCRFGLNANFRSAEIVVDATNAVFAQIMKRDIGGIDYDDDQRLIFHAEMPVSKPDTAPERIEIDELQYPEGYKNHTRAEAVHAAWRIRQMVEGDSPVYVRDGDHYRRVRYRDVVILSRFVSPIAGEYAEVFRSAGIPFFTEQKEGFYHTREVRMMLDILTVIDNPRQDIPLTAVLVSPLFGLTEEDLSRIRIATDAYRGDLYGRLELVCDAEEETEVPEETTERTRAFMRQLGELREAARLSTVSSLVEMIYDNTGIIEWFAAQPDGERRLANLDYFLHIVTQYDSGSYQGVNAFIGYIGRLIGRKGDTGEPLDLGESEDVVRMMTIHKSKGLEFPVVILVRTDKERNNNAGRFIMDPELGLAGYMDFVTDGLYKKPVIYRVLQKKNTIGDAGELLRLFYVAMTRAKDHLILIGTHKDAETAPQTDYISRMQMETFSAMLAPAVAEDADEQVFVTRVVDYEQESQMIKAAGPVRAVAEKDEDVNNFDTSKSYNDSIRELPQTPSGGEEREEPLPVKMSVSEIKKAYIEEELTEALYAERASEAEETDTDETEERLPRFMREEGPVGFTGAERGTIYHQVMATLNLASFADVSEIRRVLPEALDGLVRDRFLPEDERRIIDAERICRFLTCPLGSRMIEAAKAKRLHREQPFLLNKSSREIARYADRDEDTPIMVQGIIDAYFETEDGLVLMDYKTDQIPPGGEQSLIDRYRIQLELYRDALETVWEKPVTECYLYSFCLDEMIEVKL